MPHEPGHEEEEAYTATRDPFARTPQFEEAIEEAGPGGQTYPEWETPEWEELISTDEWLQMRSNSPSLYRRVRGYLRRGDESARAVAYGLVNAWKREEQSVQRADSIVEQQNEIRRSIEEENQAILDGVAINPNSVIIRSGAGPDIQALYGQLFPDLVRHYESGVGGHMSRERARIEATRNLMYWMVVPRSTAGQPTETAADVSPSEPDVYQQWLERAGMAEALIAALRPQIVSSEGQAAHFNFLSEVGRSIDVEFRGVALEYSRQGWSPRGAILDFFGRPEGMSQSEYDSELAEERRAQQGRLDESGEVRGRTPEGRRQSHQHIYRAMANFWLPTTMDRFTEEARQYIRQGYEGPEDQAPTDQEVNEAANHLAILQYTRMRDATFPWLDDVEHRAPGEETLEEGWHTFGGIPIPDIAGRALETAGQFVRGAFYTEVERPGREWAPQQDVVETYAMAGMRDVAGIVRIAIDPMLEALSYTVDARGNPVDPNDWNYLLNQAHEEAYREWEAGDQSPLQAAWNLATLTTGYTVGALTRFELDDSRTDMPRISTGNWVRDAAASIAQGRFLAQDFQAIVGTGYWYDQVQPELLGVSVTPYRLGFGAELLLPINPMRVAGPAIQAGARVASRTSAFAGRGAGALADVVTRSTTAGDFLRAAGVWTGRGVEIVTSPVALARQAIVFREFRAGLAGSGVTRTTRQAFSDVGMMFRNSSFTGTLATRLSEEIILKALPLLKAGQPLLNTFKYGRGSALGGIIEQLEEAWTTYQRSYRSLDDIDQSMIGQRVLDAEIAAAFSGYRVGSDQFHQAVMGGVLEDLLRQHFAHLIPDNWVVVADMVLVPKAVFGSREFRQVQRQNRFLFEESADGVFANSRQVVDTLHEVLGFDKIRSSRFWSGVRGKILNGDPLSPVEMQSTARFLQAGIVKKHVTGSIRIDFTGPAYVRGTERAAGRASAAKYEPSRQNISTMLKGARAFLGIGKPLAVRTTDWAPIAVQRLINELNADVGQLERSFMELLSDFKKAGRDPLEEAISRFRGEDAVSDLIDIMQVFFREALESSHKPELNKRLVAAGFGSRPLTTDMIPSAIAAARQYIPALSTAGIRRGRPIIGQPRPKKQVDEVVDAAEAARTDELDPAVYAWAMDRHRSELISGHMSRLTNEYPELTIRMGGDDILDADRFRLLANARSQPLPKDIVEDVIAILFGESRTAPMSARLLDEMEVGLGSLSRNELSEFLTANPTGRAAAEYIAKNADNPSYRKIAERILPFLDDVEIIVARDGMRIPMLIAGGYNRQGRFVAARGLSIIQPGKRGGTVWLRSAEQANGINVETLLHELVHQASQARLADARLFANKGTRAQEIYLELRQLAGLVDRRLKQGPGLRPGSTGLPTAMNTDELVAWGLTNKEFQDFLQTIKLDGEQTAFSRFVDMIADLLGISRAEKTALTETIRLTDELLSVQLRDLSTRKWTGDVVSRETSTSLMSAATSAPASAIDKSHIKRALEILFSDLMSNGSVGPADLMFRQWGTVIRGGGNISDIMRVGPVRDAVFRSLKKRMPGRSDDAINRLADPIIEDIYDLIIDSVTHVDMPNLIGKLRSIGVSIPIGRASHNIAGVEAKILQLEGNIGVVISNRFLSAEDKKTFNRLMDATAEGKLGNMLQDLPKDLKEAALQSVLDFVNTTNRIAVSGTLGGFLSPIARFLGNNNITAPLIVAITQPTYVTTALRALVAGTKRGYVGTAVGALTGGAIGEATLKALDQALGHVPSRSRPVRWYMSKFMAQPNDVVMIDRWGRRWTKARLDHSMRTHNFRLSQTTFEFRDMTISQIRRIVSRNPDLSSASWIKQAWRYIDPRNKNVWGVLAENNDNIFREACYVEALRRGLTENQAMQVARNSMLDYGAISAIEKDKVARWMLFYAFQRQMTLEVVKTLLWRDGRAFAAQVKWVQEQHENAGTWLFERDYIRSYMYTRLGREFDNLPTLHSYVRSPGIEAFLGFNSVLSFSLDTTDMIIDSFMDDAGLPTTRLQAGGLLEGITPGTRLHSRMGARETLEELAQAVPWRPEAEAVFAVLLETFGYREGTPQRAVPDWFMRVLLQTGYFDEGAAFFDIQRYEGEVGLTGDPDELSAGRPTYTAQLEHMGETTPEMGQYRFGSQSGFGWYVAFTYLTMITGMQRTARDTLNASALANPGSIPEGAILKYKGEGNFALTVGGVETTSLFLTENAVRARIAERIQRDLWHHVPDNFREDATVTGPLTFEETDQ